MKPNTLNRFHFCPMLFAAGLATGAAHGAAVIIDDSDLTGFSQTGSWGPQDRADAQAGNWRYQIDPADPAGADSATYSFSGLTNGKYVAARSTWAQANLSNAATYTLSNGGGNYTQNQQVKTNHFDADAGGVTFQRLSNFNGYTPFEVADGTATATVADTDTNGYLIADGIRLESVRNDVQMISVIGNGDTGYSETAGGWGSWSDDPGDHGVDIRFGTTPDAAASFAFTGLVNGTYRVSSAWTTGGARPTDARYYIDGGPTITLDQTVAPNDDTFEEVGWEDLFTVEVIDGSLTVNLENAAGGSGGTALIADAVRLELIPEPSAALLGGLGGLGLLALLRRRRA